MEGTPHVFRVKQVLARGLHTQCGVHEPHVILVEEEPDRIVVLFTVQCLEGRAARTAWIEPRDGAEPEVVIAAGFLV